jgi:hypothetical protein
LVPGPSKVPQGEKNYSNTLSEELAWLETLQEDDIFNIALPCLSVPGSVWLYRSIHRGCSGLFHKIWTEENDFFLKIRGDVSQVVYYALGFLESQR